MKKKTKKNKIERGAKCPSFFIEKLWISGKIVHRMWITGG
jgi:hypothetical protein